MLLTLLILLTVYSCKSTHPSTEGKIGNGGKTPVDVGTKPLTPISHKTKLDLTHIILPDLDDYAIQSYKLKNKQLTIDVTAKSYDEQYARDLCMGNAFDSVHAVIIETCSYIEEKRGLPHISTSGIRLKNTRTLDEKKEEYSVNGRELYRITGTFQFEIESILQDLYEQIKTAKNYSYSAFCRDFDYVVEKIEK